MREEIQKGTFHEDVILKSRPKTSVNKEEAKQYGLDLDDDYDIFFTSEVKVEINEKGKFINEFKILETIGQGAYSKVKHVLRQYTEDEKL